MTLRGDKKQQEAILTASPEARLDPLLQAEQVETLHLSLRRANPEDAASLVRVYA